MKIDGIFETTGEAESIAQSVKLRAVEWKLLLAIGKLPGVTVRKLAKEMCLEESAAEQIVAKLEELRLIHDPETDWAHFAHRYPPKVLEPTQEVSAAPSNGNGSNGSRLSNNGKPESSVRIKIQRQNTPTSSTTKAIPPPRSALELKPVLDFIRQKAGGGSVGQMAVYRVFLKVSPPLLERAGLQALNLDDESVKIEDQELANEILAAVHDVLGEPFGR